MSPVPRESSHVFSGSSAMVPPPLMPLLPIDDQSTSMVSRATRERLLAGDDAGLFGASFRVRGSASPASLALGCLDSAFDEIRGKLSTTRTTIELAQREDRARKLSHGAPTDDGMSRARDA